MIAVECSREVRMRVSIELQSWVKRVETYWPRSMWVHAPKKTLVLSSTCNRSRNVEWGLQSNCPKSWLHLCPWPLILVVPKRSITWNFLMCSWLEPGFIPLHFFYLVRRYWSATFSHVTLLEWPPRSTGWKGFVSLPCALPHLPGEKEGSTQTLSANAFIPPPQCDPPLFATWKGRDDRLSISGLRRFWQRRGLDNPSCHPKLSGRLWMGDVSGINRKPLVTHVTTLGDALLVPTIWSFWIKDRLKRASKHGEKPCRILPNLKSIWGYCILK